MSESGTGSAMDWSEAGSFSWLSPFEGMVWNTGDVVFESIRCYG